MPQEPSSRPQPQYWIKFLNPWDARLLSGVGLGFGTRIGRTQLFLTPALDKNWFPNAHFLHVWKCGHRETLPLIDLTIWCFLNQFLASYCWRKKFTCTKKLVGDLIVQKFYISLIWINFWNMHFSVSWARPNRITCVALGGINYQKNAQWNDISDHWANYLNKNSALKVSDMYADIIRPLQRNRAWNDALPLKRWELASRPTNGQK